MAELTNTTLQGSNPPVTGVETSPPTTACSTASQTEGAASVTYTPTASTPSPKGTKANKMRGGRGRVPFDERAVTGGGFFVAGAWSKAGVCSCFNVRHRHLLGKHGVVFDMGVCPSEVGTLTPSRSETVEITQITQYRYEMQVHTVGVEAGIQSRPLSWEPPHTLSPSDRLLLALCSVMSASMSANMPATSIVNKH